MRHRVHLCGCAGLSRLSRLDASFRRRLSTPSSPMQSCDGAVAASGGHVPVYFPAVITTLNTATVVHRQAAAHGVAL